MADKKNKRPRTVFGRVRVDASGKLLTVSLSKTHLIVRPLHARRTYRWKLTQAVLHIMANAPLVQDNPGLPTKLSEK